MKSPGTRTAAISATVAASVISTMASGSLIEPGTYQMHDHPDGNLAPPSYGLRLDGLYDATPSTDRFTFSFDQPGTDMQLAYSEDGTIQITGTAFGGLVQNDEWVDGHSGFLQVQFTYANVTAAPNDDLWVVGPPDFENYGTVHADWNNETYALYDYSGSHGYTFRLGENHRGHDGISGWGWLNYQAGDPHIAATDWLFTLDETPLPNVPAPGAIALLGMFAAFGRRRR